ncbi:MAG TPA: hypothetical protein VNN80_28585, partial [Polyangiaceae bacterium]|nr:hypothetical protein [Polyangiaceae bacterium]
ASDLSGRGAGELEVGPSCRVNEYGLEHTPACRAKKSEKGASRGPKGKRPEAREGVGRGAR